MSMDDVLLGIFTVWIYHTFEMNPLPLNYVLEIYFWEGQHQNWKFYSQPVEGTQDF